MVMGGEEKGVQGTVAALQTSGETTPAAENEEAVALTPEQIRMQRQARKGIPPHQKKAHSYFFTGGITGGTTVNRRPL